MQKRVYYCGVNERPLDIRVFKSKISPQGQSLLMLANKQLVGRTCFVTHIASLSNYSCALIDRYRPDLLQYSTLQRHNHRRNFELAFAAAEKIEIAVSPLIILINVSLFLISRTYVTFDLTKDPS